MIEHMLDAPHGNSGAPIWVTHSGNRYMVAIDTWTDGHSFSVKLTEEVLNTVAGWMKSDVVDLKCTQ